MSNKARGNIKIILRDREFDRQLKIKNIAPTTDDSQIEKVRQPKCNVGIVFLKSDGFVWFQEFFFFREILKTHFLKK